MLKMLILTLLFVSSSVLAIIPPFIQQIITKAESGDIEAKWVVAQFYYSGKWVVKNTELAKSLDSEYYEYHLAAANKGNPSSSEKLAQYYLYHPLLYSSDNDMKKQSLKWFKKAHTQYFIKAKQGNSQAQFKYASLINFNYATANNVTEMTGMYISEENKQKRIYWLLKAAEQNHAGAQYFLGYLNYENNKQEWYKKAALNGYKSAISALAYILKQQKDYLESFKYYLMAAELGNLAAQREVSGMYYSGKGVLQSYEKGAYWLNKSALGGDISAMSSLGDRLYTGQAIKKNHVKSYALRLANNFLTKSNHYMDLYEHLSVQEKIDGQKLAEKYFYSHCTLQHYYSYKVCSGNL